MEAKFSEFSYGFSLTQELVTEYSSLLTAAPTFPSLIDEGKPGGGYDLKLESSGFPLFLQFKLSEYMIRSYASQAGLVGVPYFRFKLRALKYSKQHRLLTDLESLGNFVYYVAPMFYEVAELTAAFFGKTVSARSLFVSPSEIGPLPDEEGHCIVFNSSSPLAYFCSEPKPLKMTIHGREFAEKLRVLRSHRQPFALNEDFFSKLAEEMRKIITPELFVFDTELIDRHRREMNPLLFVSFLSRTFFDCDLLFVRA
jgi:hypothetical protein